MKIIEHVKLGKEDVKLTTPSHVPGVQQGNAGPPGSPDSHCTGINPKDELPIDPKSPNLPPA